MNEHPGISQVAESTIAVKSVRVIKTGAEREKSWALTSAVPTERARKRATEVRSKEADERLGVLVLPRQVEVARALVNSIQLFLLFYNAGFRCVPAK